MQIFKERIDELVRDIAKVKALKRKSDEMRIKFMEQTLKLNRKLYNQTIKK